MTARPPNPWDDERLSAYVDGQLDPAQRQRFEEEMARSPELHAAVDELLAIRRRLHELPRASLPVDFADRVLQAAEQRLRPGSQEGPVPGKNTMPTGPRFPWRGGMALLALAATIAVLAFLRPWGADRQQVAQVDRVADDVAPVTPPAPVLSATDEAKEARRPDARPSDHFHFSGGPEEPSAAAVDSDARRKAITDNEGSPEPFHASGGNKPADAAPADQAEGALADALGKDSSSAGQFANCERTIVVAPQTRGQAAFLKQLLATPDVASASVQAPSEETSGDSKLTVGRAAQHRAEQAMRAGERGSSSRVREARSSGDRMTVYDAFLVTAPSPDALDEFVSQLETAKIATQTFPVPVEEQPSWQALVQQLPQRQKTPAPAGTAVELDSPDRPWRAQSQQAIAGLAVTLLGQLAPPQAPSSMGNETVHALQQQAYQLGTQQLPRFARNRSEKAADETTTADLPCSLLLIIESGPLEED